MFFSHTIGARKKVMWPVNQALASVGCAIIVDFPTHPPKDFKLLYSASVVYNR